MFFKAALLIVLGVFCFFVTVVALIFGIIAFANNKKEKYIWLGTFFCSLTGLIICVNLFVHKAISTMQNFGADSFAGRLSCVFQGSSDTIFYVLALYFGSVGIKQTRYTLWAGLTADLVSIITAIWVSYIFF